MEGFKISISIHVLFPKSLWEGHEAFIKSDRCNSHCVRPVQVK